MMAQSCARPAILVGMIAKGARHTGIELVVLVSGGDIARPFTLKNLRRPREIFSQWYTNDDCLADRDVPLDPFDQGSKE